MSFPKCVWSTDGCLTYSEAHPGLHHIFIRAVCLESNGRLRLYRCGRGLPEVLLLSEGSKTRAVLLISAVRIGGRGKKNRLFFEFLTCQFKHTFKITRILCAFMLSELYLKCRKSLSFLTCAWIRAAPGAKDVMGFFLLFFSTSVQIRRVLRVTSQRIYRVCSIASFVTSFFFMRIKYGNLWL